MVSLTIFAGGVAGIYGLQMAAVRGNSDAQEVTAATHVARRFLEMLRRDALRWNDPSPGSPASDLERDTRYLGLALTAAGTWRTPDENPWNRQGGPDRSPDHRLGQFCVQYRLAWVSVALVDRLLRAEVRVWWHRPGSNRALYPDCGRGTEAAMGADTVGLRWVYVSAALTRTVL